MIILLGNLFSGEKAASSELITALGIWLERDEPASSVQISGAVVDSWRSLLQQIPLDERSFNDMYAPRTCDVFLADLSEWCLSFRSRSERFQRTHRELFAFLSLLLITWLGVRESERRRRATQDFPPSGTASAIAVSHDCGSQCRVLIRDRLVRQTILRAYAPDCRDADDGLDATTLDRWDEIDPDSLVFHRHGTTSIILRGKLGVRDSFALKLILFPFLRFPTIARQTRQYRSRYNPEDRASGHMVDVWASTERWILMDFVEGLTLSELLPRPQLVERKLANPEQSFSQILRTHLTERRTLDRTGIPLDMDDLCDLTLDELLQLAGTEMEQPPARKVSKDHKVSQRWVEALGIALFDALDSVQRTPEVFTSRPTAAVGVATEADPLPHGVHGDLTPSNIVANDAPGLIFTLIDFGRNYLYTQSISGQGGPDAAYVAPEIKDENGPAGKADLYSLGQLLIAFGLRGGRPSGLIPDEFYARVPLVARFLEDLVQEDPEQRLMIFYVSAQDSGRQATYADLRTLFLEELAAVRAADREGLTLREDSVLAVLRDLAKPMSGAPARQWRLWRIRRKQVYYRRRQQGGYTRWLFAWSSVSAVAGTLAMATVTAWFLRDIGWSWTDRTIEALQKLTGGNENQFPFLDSLQAAGYHIPDLRANWPARLVGVSYVLIGARYYQALFSGLTPLMAWRGGFRDWRTFLAEFFMRLETVTSMILVLAATLVEARWWPIASAIGQTISLLCNWSVVSFARKAISTARAEGISTVAGDDHAITGLDSLAEWIPSSLFYTVVVWLIGSLIYIHVLHDIAVYAISVAAINIFLFYIIKCGIGAPTIRVAIARSCLCAERLRMAHANTAEKNGELSA